MNNVYLLASVVYTTAYGAKPARRTKVVRDNTHNLFYGGVSTALNCKCTNVTNIINNLNLL